MPATASNQFIEKIKFPSGQTVVVAEGEFEPRSIDSFSIRLYQAAPMGDETTFFDSGIIRERDGAIEKIILSDINCDGHDEIIVAIRSTGSGSYLSAQAFSINANQQLSLSSSIEGQPANIDPVAALKSTCK